MYISKLLYTIYLLAYKDDQDGLTNLKHFNILGW